MPLFLLKLIGIWGWLKQAAVGALRWLMGHPWQAALIVALCACAWLWRGKQAALSDLAACETKSAQLSAAIDAANKLAEQARAKSVTIAKDADNDHKERSKVSRVATDNYVSRNRLPAQADSDRTPAEGSPAGNDQGPAAVPVMVAMSEPDVRAAAALRDYAVTCYKAGQELISAGLAD